MYKIIVLLVLQFPFFCNSQDLKKDTILTLRSVFDNTNLDFTSSIERDSDLIYVLPSQALFSKTIIQINLKEYNSQELAVKNTNFEMDQTDGYNWKILGSNLGFIYFQKHNSSIYVFEKKGNELTLKAKIPVGVAFQKVFAINDSTFFGYSVANRHPKSKMPQRLCVKFSINGKIISKCSPKFENIEFAHFSPHSWVDFSAKNCYFFETTKPSFEKINLETFARKKFMLESIPWIDFNNTTYYKKLRKNNFNQFVNVFDSLKGYVSSGKIDRIQYGYYMSEDTIMLICNTFVANSNEKKYYPVKRILVLKKSSFEKDYSILKDFTINYIDVLPKGLSIYPFENTLYYSNGKLVTIEQFLKDDKANPGIENKLLLLEVGIFNINFNF